MAVPLEKSCFQKADGDGPVRMYHQRTFPGIPCSAAALKIMDEKDLGDALVKEANAKVTGFCKFPLDPKFEHNDLKANPDGVYYKVFGKLSAGDIDSASAAAELVKGINECMGN